MHTPLHSPGSGWAGTRRKWAQAVLALALPLLGNMSAQAQSLANYTFAASAGTFTALSGATTAPTTGGSSDDDVTAVLPIGFQFVYNGVAYSTFSASTNGFMGLGSQVGSVFSNNLSTGATRPLLAPLWDDMDISAATNISYQTNGTAGSRVLTVQWLNVKWNYNATAAVESYQAKLYEADGHVDFVYRQEAGAVNQATASIGITAVGTGAGNFLSLSDATAAPTASSTAETTSIATKPATGQTYTFTPAGGAVLAPSALTFSAISTTGATVTFTDNSTNEYGFAVTVTPTAGGASTTSIVPSTTTAGTGTTYTYNFTNLSANTGYTVQVVALGQGQGSTAGSGTFTTLAGATLSGTYYVGTSTSPQPTRTYATLTAAAAAYNTATLGGAVTFLLLDNAYGSAETFPITFGVNSSASATNTLTISPNTGVNATITAPATVTAPSTGGGVLLLNGADYITINGSNTAGGTTRNLTLTTSSTTGVAAIQLASLGTGAGATNDVIRNLNITGPSSSAGVGIVVGGTAVGTTGADNDNLTVQNNSIASSFSGIFVLGTAAVSAGGTDGLVITGNTLGGTTGGTSSLGNVGMLINNAVSPSITLNTIQNISGAGSPIGFSLTGATGALISQNTVRNVSSTGGNATGVALGAGSTGATITRNVLTGLSASSASGYGGKGIDVQTGSATSNVLIANNFIQITAASGWTSLTSDANVGIRLGTTGTLGGVNVYYNSVNLTGTYARTGADLSAALYVGSASTALDIRNNILINGIVNSTTSTSKSYAFYSAAANTAFTQLNYNDYFVTGTQGVLGYLGADAATLAALQTATGKDANSVSVDPLFVSTTDLHVNSAALNNVGTAIASVTVDIDGDPRSATTPDIGADEFAPVGTDIAAAGLIAPATAATGGACFGSAEAVTVSIRNAGASALNFATTPATITVVVTGPTGVATQMLNYTLSTGTLAAGATLSVPLTGAGNTVNLATLGTYSFAITANVTGDANTANNTLTPSPTITVAAPVAGTLASSAPSLCNSGTTTLSLTGALNGAIQLQSSTSATGTFTNITGATAATFTTPVINSTTYYRAQVTCGTTVVTSNVVTVTVNNPQLTGTPAPVSVCAGSTATLSASAPTGTTVQFYSTATGGTPLPGATTVGTGTTVTTTALTASTTYYAEASTGTSEIGGRQAPTVTAGFLGIDTGLIFSTTTALTIQSAVIYPVGTGTLTFALRNSAGTEIAATQAISVTGSGASTPVTVQLNLAVPSAGTGYQLVVKAFTGITDLLRENPLPTGAAFPFTSPSGNFSITGGLNGTPNSAYYYFYNISLSNACVGATRTPIAVTVIQLPATPTVTVSYPTSSTALFTSSAAPAGTTYQWYQGGTLIPGATNQTYTATGTTTPTGYSVRFITTTGSCQSAASTPVTITGTAKLLAGSALTLFPNPTADGMLTLQFKGYSKAVQLSVFDALGREVLTQNVAAGQAQTQLNLSAAATGVYTLRVTTEGGTDIRRIVRE